MGMTARQSTMLPKTCMPSRRGLKDIVQLERGAGAKTTSTARRTQCYATGSELSSAELAAAGAGLIANPICLWSEFTLKTTGSGLPPGPGGALGAAEGISYLVRSPACSYKTGHCVNVDCSMCVLFALHMYRRSDGQCACNGMTDALATHMWVKTGCMCVTAGSDACSTEGCPF